MPEATFNPNGYGAEQIATALKKAYEGYSASQIDGMVSNINTQIQSLDDSLSEETEELTSLYLQLLSATGGHANVLSITQEDLEVTTNSNDDYISLLPSGMIHVAKTSEYSMTADFTKVFIPKTGSGGLYGMYYIGFTSLPENITASLIVNGRTYYTFTHETPARAMTLTQDLYGAVLRIKVAAEGWFTGIDLKPYCAIPTDGAWSDSDWTQFFPSLTWLASLAKEDRTSKVIFEGSKNLLDTITTTATPSDENVTAAVDNTGRITLSKTGSSAGSLTISGISLKAGTYWFNVIGDNDEGADAMSSKLMDGSDVIVEDRVNGAARPVAFTLESDATGLDLVIDISADAEPDSVLMLPYVSVKTGSTEGILDTITWEPFYPSIIDLYRGLS